MSFMGMRKMLILKGNWKRPGVVLGRDGQFVLVRQGGSYFRVHPSHSLKVRKGNYQKEESEIDQLIKKEDFPTRESLETNIQQWKVNSDQTDFLHEPSDQEESTQSKTDSIDESDESVSKESDDEVNNAI